MEEQLNFSDFDSLDEKNQDYEIQIIILFGGTVLITKIAPVVSELGEPDCKLLNPYKIIHSGDDMIPWMNEYTDEDEFMISSDKILTILEPKPKFIEKYLERTK
jgi:hypothetical protein